MKIFYTTLLFFAFNLSSLAQVFYQKKIQNFYFEDIVRGSGNSAYLTGDDTTGDFKICKVDLLTGNISWSLSIVSPASTATCYTTNSLLMETSRHTLITEQTYECEMLGGIMSISKKIFEIDSLGQIQRQWNFDDLFEDTQLIIENPDGSIAFYGNRDDYNDFIMVTGLLDSSGNIVSYYETDFYDFVNIIPNRNGNYTGLSGFDNYCTIFEIDSQRNILFSTVFDIPLFYPIDLVQASDSSYVVYGLASGEYYILRFDASGSFLNGVKLDRYIGKLMTAGNGIYFTYSNGIVKMDLNLNFIYAKNLSNSTQFQFSPYLIMNDSDIILSATSNSSMYDAWFIRTDSDAIINCSHSDTTMTLTSYPITTMTGQHQFFTQSFLNASYPPATINNNNISWSDSCFTIPSGIHEVQSADVSVFPFVTNGIIYIQSDEIWDEIIIYDLTGSVVMRVPFIQQIDLSELSTGYYLVQIMSGSKNVVRKIIRS